MNGIREDMEGKVALGLNLDGSAGQTNTAKNEPEPKLSEHPTDEEMQAFFCRDLFASKQANCRIVECWIGHGKAEMDIVPSMHFNAGGHVMGGAVFTLADYAFAAASMPGSVAAVSLTSTIEFMKSTKGSKLIATCDVDHVGRKVGFYTTDVVDDLGVHIARVVTTCYKPTVR